MRQTITQPDKDFFKLLKQSANSGTAEFCLKCLLEADLPLNSKVFGVPVGMLMGVLLAAKDKLPRPPKDDCDD